jgi:hypothetical protein
MLLTRALRPVIQYTPFLLGFVAAVISTRVAGRQAGFLTVLLGVLGYGLLPLPLAQERLGRLLLGFAGITVPFSWIAVRRRPGRGEFRITGSTTAITGLTRTWLPSTCRERLAPSGRC